MLDGPGAPVPSHYPPPPNSHPPRMLRLKDGLGRGELDCHPMRRGQDPEFAGGKWQVGG